MVPLLLLEELSNPTQTNIPVRITRRPPSSVKSYIRSSIIRENLIRIDVNGPISPVNSTPVTEPTSKRMFVPNILLANVMSLTPKIDEIRVFSKSIDIDLFFITETWLKNTINDNQVTLSGYNLERLDRRIGVHGGVCLFSKIGIRTTRLLTLESPTLEVMWVQVRPRRLPRGFPCIITATIYHPPSADDNELLEYISSTLTSIEGNFPGCGIIITGDFNQLNVRDLCRNFNLKQLVRVPTRGRNTLD